MAADDGPTHESSVNAEITDPYEEAVERNSAANPLQADPATSIDSEPGPA
jgi:hypothetical protein